MLIARVCRTQGFYREMQLKDKLPGMTLEEKYKLLASDGMLVKRPILITEDQVVLGFKETAYEEVL